MMASTDRFSETKPVTEEINGICLLMKDFVEAKTNKTYKEFFAIEYKKSVGDETQYLIKVDVGGDRYLHLTVLKLLKTVRVTVQLILYAYQENHKRDDPLEPIPPFN